MLTLPFSFQSQLPAQRDYKSNQNCFLTEHKSGNDIYTIAARVLKGIT